MGCLSHRKKQTENLADQKWEYINLNDFTAKGCATIFAYIYLWLMLLVSVAVYAVDSFTAVNLLAFNKWSGGIDPAIDITYSKWIFSVCIILSFLNLGYEGFRAFKVIRKGNVAESYLDSLAVRWESIRIFGSGQGFRRFLVFAELTKSKKGAHYIALFTYFSFQSWIRVIICSGPRQVVNALTIKAVYDAQLISDAKSVESSITGFFNNIKTLAEKDYRQALTLSGMCFTLVVWVFSALFLLAALLFWIFFLWHWIPSADGGLSGYCSRKVTKTLMTIVHAKVDKAIAKQEATRLRSELKAAKIAQATQQQFEKPRLDRAPTVPTLPNVSPDKLQGMPALGRSETMQTLPPYTSRPGSPGGVELSNMEKRRPPPSRTGTMASNYSSRTPLVGSASEMGSSPPPRMPQASHNYPRRQDTMGSSYSNASQQSQQPLRPMMSTSSRDRFTETPGPMYGEPMPYAPPPRAPSARPMDNYSQSNDSFAPIPTPAPSYKSYDAYNPDDRASPAPTLGSQWGGPQRMMTASPMDGPMGPPMGGPQRMMTASPMDGPMGPPMGGPQRMMTASPMNAPMGPPMGGPMPPPMRSNTAPIPRGAPQYPQRNMTAPPPQALSPVGESSERYSMTSSVMSTVIPQHLAYPEMTTSPPPRGGAASVAPSSVVLGPTAHAAMAGPPPVPRVSPSPGPGPGGPQQGYQPFHYDTESQRGYGNGNGNGNWN